MTHPCPTPIAEPIVAPLAVTVPTPPTGLRLRTNVRAGECNGTAGRCPAGQHPISYTGPRGIYITRCFDCGYDW